MQRNFVKRLFDCIVKITQNDSVTYSIDFLYIPSFSRYCISILRYDFTKIIINLEIDQHILNKNGKVK
jgi:hypothetical protein